MRRRDVGRMGTGDFARPHPTACVGKRAWGTAPTADNDAGNRSAHGADHDVGAVHSLDRLLERSAVHEARAITDGNKEVGLVAIRAGQHVACEELPALSTADTKETAVAVEAT